MRQYLFVASALLVACVYPTAQAVTTASGSVLFNFNTTPSAVSYGYAEGYFGNVDGVQAYFDDDYSTSLQVGQSSMFATWDPVTGNATDYGLTAISSGPNSYASVNYAIYFTLTTDVLSFSYDYDYFGQRSSTGNGNNVSMAVQISIESPGGTVYTDYDPSHPSFQTNFAYFELEGTAANVLDESGNVSFEYGNPGVVQTWFVTLDVLASGSDTVGVVPLPASLPLLLGSLALLGFFHVRRGEAPGRR